MSQLALTKKLKTIKMYSNEEKTKMILIYGECNKNPSDVAPLCRQYFSQFYLTKRMTFMSNLRNCTANYSLFLIKEPRPVDLCL
jgi:hypothetical protein